MGEMTNLENDILIRQNFNEIYKSYMENRPSSVITVVDKRKMEQTDQSQNDNNNNTNFNDFANEKWPTSPENLIANPPSINNQHQPINPITQSKTALTNLPKQKNDSGVSSSPFSRN